MFSYVDKSYVFLFICRQTLECFNLLPLVNNLVMNIVLPVWRLMSMVLAPGRRRREDQEIQGQP